MLHVDSGLLATRPPSVILLPHVEPLLDNASSTWTTRILHIIQPELITDKYDVTDARFAFIVDGFLACGSAECLNMLEGWMHTLRLLRILN